MPSHDAFASQWHAFEQFLESHPTRQLRCGKFEWEYIVSGAGSETILLLPGGMRVAETWFGLIGSLENDYRVIALTYPAVDTVAECVRGVFAILDAENAGAATLIGASLGGWVAQALVRDRPQAVPRVVLSNTSPPSSIPRAVGLVKYVIPVYPLGVLRYGLRRNFLKIIGAPEPDRKFWGAFLKRSLAQATKGDIAALYILGLDFRNTCRFAAGDLVGWDGSMLVIESANDAAIKRGAREALKELYPEATVHTFESAGHCPGYTRPEAFEAVIRGFLA